MVQKISMFFYALGLLFPVFCISQKNAEFESEFIMTNVQGKSVKFIIGFDKNAYEAYEDTVFGEYNLFRPNQDILFRDSFDIMLHTFNVFSFNKSIIQSLKCGEYEYGIIELIVKVNTPMFPLVLKWNKTNFNGLCVSRSYFAPSIMGPLMGNFSDIISLRNLDSLIITNEMAKSESLYTYLGSNNVDTIRYMHFLFRAQGASINQIKENENTPTITYKSGAFVLSNIDRFNELNVYSMNGSLISKIKLPKASTGEISIPWTPPSNSIFIANLNGKGGSKSVKLYCY